MVQHPVLVDGSACGCRRSIFSSLLSASSSSSSYSLKDRTSNSSSSSFRNREKQSRAVKRRESKKRKGVAEESVVAVLKESLNPYFDFYESMLVMIMEKEMYDWEDLCELLHRYISLNSSCHHHIILRAFADVWNDVFSPEADLPGGSTATIGRSEVISRPESQGRREDEIK